MPPVPGVYHTHTFRCKHASGDVADYARAAAAAGLSVLGASDHTPLPDGRWGDVRMTLDQLPDYEAAVAAARVAVPQVRILLGMECDVDVRYLTWYRDTFLARGYDYLIASLHYLDGPGGEISAFGACRTPAVLRDWAGKSLAAIESGLFACLAHPDNIAHPDAAWTPEVAAVVGEVCAAAAAHGLPLELNSLGLRQQRGYPWRPFWEVAAAQGCRVVLASDAHHAADTARGLTDMAALATELGLATQGGIPAPPGRQGSGPAGCGFPSAR